MAFDISRTLEVITNHLSTSGYFAHIELGDPKAPPSENIAAYVLMDKVSVVEMTLQSPRELHVVTIRLFKNMLEEPQSGIETEMARAASDIMASFYGEFDLDETIVFIDIAGIYGSPMSAEWGYIDSNHVMFRTCDINIPLIVDDSGTLVP
jgi:hypothetical protein